MLINKTSALRRCYSSICLLMVAVAIILINHTAESRHLNVEDAITEVPHGSKEAQTSVLDEDANLENVVEDYYDDLWQYLEKLIAEKEKNNTVKAEKKTAGSVSERLPSVPDYDYMADMAASAPDLDRLPDNERFKTSSKDETKTQWKMENKTHTGEFGSNTSHGNVHLTDIVRANRESNSEEEFAQRSKEIRLKSIISQVLSFRGGNPKANASVPDIKHFNALKEIYEKSMQRIKTDDWTASYTEKIQSFYPSCDLPKNTDEDLWSDPYAMNLLFDLEYPSPQEDSTIMIVSAKLRIYKLPQENYLASNTESLISKSKTEKNQNNLGILPGDDDRQIRVSVYWYTRSLRRHRAKKKLLDSQMIAMHRPKWAEFNIRAAVRTWKDSGKNFGLVVTVEDEDGTHLPAEQFIQSMNCSKWTATIRPIPSIILDKANQYYVENAEKQNGTVGEEEKSENKQKHRIYPYEPLPYPIIDLRTREVPNAEVKNLALVNSAKIALESKLINFTQNGFFSNSNNSNSNMAIFFKNYNNNHNNGISFDQGLNTKFDKSSNPKQSDTKISYFQNVPIGSPSNSKINRNFLTSSGGKSSGSYSEDAEGRQSKMSDFVDISKVYKEVDAEKEKPKIRHSRRHWEIFHKSNLNSRHVNDRNSTDHH